jgi:hypothetical protein
MTDIYDVASCRYCLDSPPAEEFDDLTLELSGISGKAEVGFAQIAVIR